MRGKRCISTLSGASSIGALLQAADVRFENETDSMPEGKDEFHWKIRSNQIASLMQENLELKKMKYSRREYELQGSPYPSLYFLRSSCYQHRYALFFNDCQHSP